MKVFRTEYPGKQHLLQTLIKKFKFDPLVAVYALLATGVQNNIQVAIMFVVEADEDNDGKMRHNYIAHDLDADDQDESSLVADQSNHAFKRNSNKIDIEEGTPSNEICFICSN